ncbi:dihydrolipoyllysine-residue succinyltransferase, partial [Plectosphaerella plurivora]
PQMADSLIEGTLKYWSKSIRDHVDADEELASIETDKIDIPVTAPKAGVITEYLASKEDTVTVGQDLIKIDTESKFDSCSAPGAPSSCPPSSCPPSPGFLSSTNLPVTPMVRTTGSREERRVKICRMRLRIAERLKLLQNTAAALTTFNEVDMASFLEFWRLYEDETLKKGVKLGFMGAFARACTLMIRDIPTINASIENDDTIVYHDYIYLSVAVATEKGLVTPDVHNTELLDILSIESKIS